MYRELHKKELYLLTKQQFEQDYRYYLVYCARNTILIMYEYLRIWKLLIIGIKITIKQPAITILPWNHLTQLLGARPIALRP